MIRGPRLPSWGADSQVVRPQLLEPLDQVDDFCCFGGASKAESCAGLPCEEDVSPVVGVNENADGDVLAAPRINLDECQDLDPVRFTAVFVKDEAEVTVLRAVVRVEAEEAERRGLRRGAARR